MDRVEVVFGADATPEVLGAWSAAGAAAGGAAAATVRGAAAAAAASSDGEKRVARSEAPSPKEAALVALLARVVAGARYARGDVVGVSLSGTHGLPPFSQSAAQATSSWASAQPSSSRHSCGSLTWAL